MTNPHLRIRGARISDILGGALCTFASAVLIVLTFTLKDGWYLVLTGIFAFLAWVFLVNIVANRQAWYDDYVERKRRGLSHD